MFVYCIIIVVVSLNLELHPTAVSFHGLITAEGWSQGGGAWGVEPVIQLLGCHPTSPC